MRQHKKRLKRLKKRGGNAITLKYKWGEGRQWANNNKKRIQFGASWDELKEGTPVQTDTQSVQRAVSTLFSWSVQVSTVQRSRVCQYLMKNRIKEKSGCTVVTAV